MGLHLEQPQRASVNPRARQGVRRLLDAIVCGGRPVQLMLDPHVAMRSGETQAWASA